MAEEYTNAWKGDKNTRIYEDKEGNLTIKEGGTRAWRNNNPGNLIKSPFSKSHDSIGDDGTFAIFPSIEVGRKAKTDLLKTESYQEKTIEGAMNKYAPPAYNPTDT